MMYASKELIGILPPRLRQCDLEHVQEIRLRLGNPAVLMTDGGLKTLPGTTTQEEIHFTVNAACRYSPWAAAGAAEGYLTAPGGHRLGLCGETVVQEGKMTGLRQVLSVNIRVARDFPGIAKPLLPLSGSILILGKPGAGKTTLLRDLCRQLSLRETVCLLDRRGEVLPREMQRAQVDVLTGCPMEAGLDALVRTMTPQTLAVDEITAPGDSQALLQAGWCGVRLIATAHAASREELCRRPVYKPLVESKLFSYLVILQEDKSFRTERMVL